MPAVLLVRHAQGSFEGPDYDVLSARGHEQAAVLAERLSRLGGVRRVVHGSLRRQVQTADRCLEELGQGVERAADPRWDEYGHEDLLACLPPPARDQVEGEAGDQDPRRVFQELLDTALTRWTSGAHDRDYRESFSGFTSRVRAGFTALVGSLQPSETVVVVTSGGVISAVCADLLGLDAARWVRLNQVMANTGITKVVSGRSGITLLTVNDHAHVEAARDALLTYR